MRVLRLLALFAIFALSTLVYAANWDKDDVEVRRVTHPDL